MRATSRSLVGLFLALAALAFATPAIAGPPVPAPVAVTSSGPSGSGRIEDGRPCAEGGDGRYWHYEYTGAVAPGGFTGRAAELRLHVNLHHDTGATKAFLLDDESHASLLDDRGTLRVRLRSGTCTVPTLTFDGTTTTGVGTWEVDDGAGAYAGAAGSGTFTLSAAVAPGADNAWSLQLAGSITVPEPQLSVAVVGTNWGGLGTDYLLRRVTVRYRITNTGPGPAFAAKLAAAVPQTNGVTSLGPVPQSLGDLAPGESIDVAVRYQLGLLQPCQLVVLGCQFASAIGVTWTDALDRPSSPVVNGLAVKAPNLPPPL